MTKKMDFIIHEISKLETVAEHFKELSARIELEDLTVMQFDDLISQLSNYYKQDIQRNRYTIATGKLLITINLY